VSIFAFRILHFIVDKGFVLPKRSDLPDGSLLISSEKNTIDRSIAATAKVHRLIVVTMNTKHYKKCGVRVFDPSKTNPKATTRARPPKRALQSRSG
jgi:hypothetical protein